MISIKISNSRLELVKLDYFLGCKRIKGLEKKKLKYQVVYFTSSNGLLPRPVKAYGISEFSIHALISEKYDEAWVIRKCGKNDALISYDRYECSVLLNIFRCLYKEHLDTAELICHAINDGPLLTGFYKSCGVVDYVDPIISTLLVNPKPRLVDKNYALQYQRSRYSVYDLLYDLVKDKASIYIGPDLVSYKKMSVGSIRDSKSLFSWSRVTSVLGNKERANLSLVSYSEVEIDVPENKFGVEPGKKRLKEFKTNCIIKDSLIWTREIGVKISKKLYKTLINTGVIKSSLIFEDEFLLDLSKIPVISKKYLKVSEFDLSKAEIKSKLASYAIFYKDIIDNYKKPIVNMSDQKKFLKSLGIKGNTYSAICKIKKERCLTSEKVPVITSVFSAFPNTSAKTITDIRNFVGGRKCKNKLLESYLKTLDPKLLNINILTKEKDELDKKIRDLKFRLMLGKRLHFKDTKKDTVMGKSYKTLVQVVDTQTSLLWENKLKEIEF